MKPSIAITRSPCGVCSANGQRRKAYWSFGWVEGHSIRDYGARGDGATDDTAAIQRAIEACHAAGGGIVLFPAGTYLSGTVTLKSNVTLEFAAQARLLGSTELAAYPRPERDVLQVIQQPCLALIRADGATNIGLRGGGTIEGQGVGFDWRKPRPNLLLLVGCHGVMLQEALFKDSAVYACLLVGCTDVWVRGIRIRSRVRPNADGLDLSSCENVRISDCDIWCGDDGIGLKNDIDRPCRNIVITNCIISTRWAAFRFGPESIAGYQNITVSNCVIHDTFGCGIKLQMVEGASMENIVFSNIVMNNVTGPISLRLGEWETAERPHGPRGIGTLRNIQFHNIRATVAETATGHSFEPGVPGQVFDGEQRSCISLNGLPGHPIENVTMSDIHITFPGGGTLAEGARRDIPELPRNYPEYFMFGILPAYGLYARHARRLALRNVRFDLASRDLRPAIMGDDVDDFELTNFRLMADPQAEALIRLRGVGKAWVRNGIPSGTTRRFLCVEESPAAKVRLAENDVPAE